MQERVFIDNLHQALRRGQWIALAPLSLGAALAAISFALHQEINFWLLLLLAFGGAATAALLWLQSSLIDQQFFPQIAQTRGLEMAPSGEGFLRLLPDEIRAIGTRQRVSNAVRADFGGQFWQAGFLECSHRDLRTGSSKTLFSGQIVQLQCAADLPDFLLLPQGLRLRRALPLSRSPLPHALQIGAKGQTWALTLPEACAQDIWAEACAKLLEDLPSPPAPAQIIALFCRQGWLQIICAQKSDLFSLWQGILPARDAHGAAQNVFNALLWAERAAFGLAVFEKERANPAS